MITITNNLERTVKVSINKWGSSGDTSGFSIEPKQSETWDRTDERGFVAYVHGENIRSLVLAGKTYNVSELLSHPIPIF